MEFGVSFNSSKPNQNILDKIGTAGIDFLDMFREEYPQYNSLSYEDIKYYDHCPINGTCIDAIITENFARESGLFKGRTHLSVTVGNFMNKYVDLDVSEEIRSRYIKRKFLCFNLSSLEEEYLGYVTVRNRFNFEEMLNDWRLAGFPLKWNV